MVLFSLQNDEGQWPYFFGRSEFLCHTLSNKPVVFLGAAHQAKNHILDTFAACMCPLIQ